MDTSARQKHRPSRQARRKATASIRFFPFKIIKSSCARAARAPYGLGFRTFPNDQRDKLPFGNLYYIEIRYVPINNVKKAYTEKDLKICEKLLRYNAEQFTGCYKDNLKIIL